MIHGGRSFDPNIITLTGTIVARKNYLKVGETILRISDITSEGMTYVNLDKEIFIDFKECNENWVMYNKRKNNWTDEEVEAYRAKSKCVGQRDICAKPCCFTFFTKPFTKIEFTNFNAKKDFRDLQMKILEAGWTTFDLS